MNAFFLDVLPDLNALSIIIGAVSGLIVAITGIFWNKREIEILRDQLAREKEFYEKQLAREKEFHSPVVFERYKSMIQELTAASISLKEALEQTQLELAKLRQERDQLAFRIDSINLASKSVVQALVSSKILDITPSLDVDNEPTTQIISENAQQEA